MVSDGSRSPSKNVLPSPLLPLLLLVGTFYINFVSRIVLSPLLPVIERDLGLGHAKAGSLFLLIAVGYCAGLFGSGFVTSRLSHRHTILLSAGVMGLAMLGLSWIDSIVGIYFGLMIAGLSSGFYLPSAIAIITDVIRKERWGRAIAIHELAPNLGFVTAPFLAEASLRFLSWRGTLSLLGVWSILMGALFFLFGQGGDHKGEAPHFESMRALLSRPFLWIMGGFFTVSIGASLGVYSMIPLFFVNELGMSRGWANTLTGFSRVSGILGLLLAGWITDRFGHRPAMLSFVATTGALTFLIGFVHSPVMTPLVAFLQAISSVALFPVGFTIVSLMIPSSIRNVVVSLVVLMGFLVGGGMIPLGIGYLAEISSFSLGFSLLGILMLGMLPILLRIEPADF